MCPCSISIVVPVYQSEPILPALVERLDLVREKLGIPFEAILVNDGSRDRSWEVIAELARSRSWLKGIRLSRNYGQHNALLCGIRVARHEVIVTLDDDLQQPPEEIPKLLAKLDEGFDVVYGTPNKQQHVGWRKLASLATKMVLQGAMGADIARQINTFRAFRTRLRDAFGHFQGPHVSIDVLLTWSTNRFSAVQVPHSPRMIGESNYTFRKLITHALNLVTGFSALPLRLASVVGLSTTLFGLVALVYVVVRYLLQESHVPGFAFLASLTIILSGAQLLTLGVFGEYLARIHFRMMDRPAYAVAATTGMEEGAAWMPGTTANGSNGTASSSAAA